MYVCVCCTTCASLHDFSFYDAPDAHVAAADGALDGPTFDDDGAYTGRDISEVELEQWEREHQESW